MKASSEFLPPTHELVSSVLVSPWVVLGTEGQGRVQRSRKCFLGEAVREYHYTNLLT